MLSLLASASMSAFALSIFDKGIVPESTSHIFSRIFSIMSIIVFPIIVFIHYHPRSKLRSRLCQKVAAHGEQIIVSVQVDTDDEGNETVCYLHASHCEGDYWENSLAKEMEHFGSLITHTDAPFNVFFGKKDNPSHDIHLLVICSR